MRWRLGPSPQAAFALALLCACIAGMRFLRSEATPVGLKPPLSIESLKPTHSMEWLKPTVAAAAFALSPAKEGAGFLTADLSAAASAEAEASATAVSPAEAKPFTIDSTLSHDLSGCAGARSTVWNPLAGVEYTGRIRIDLPARSGGAIALFIGDTLPLDVEAETSSGAPVKMQQRRLGPGPGLHIPPDFWLEDANPWSAPGHIISATIDAHHDRDLSFVISLGRRAPRVLARLIGYPADVRVPVCAVPVRAGETYFATGWYAEQSSGPHTERWMRDVGAVLVYSDRGGATTVRIRATAAATTADDPARLTLRVNDILEMPPVAMREGIADYEWVVPDAAWVPGTNELLFSVSRTAVRGTRVFGMGLRELTLLRRE
jgi:hypothetical protein